MFGPMKFSVAGRVAPALTFMKLAGGAGALAGGLTAAYYCIPKVAKGQMKFFEAGKIVARESAGTGIASGLGAGVMAILGLEGFVGLAGLILVSSMIKDKWDTALERKETGVAQIGMEPNPNI